MEILLVEDNLSDVQLTVEGLRRGHIVHRLTIARTGEEALEFLRCEGVFARAPRPDLILLDLGLPKMSGHEVLEAVNVAREQGVTVVSITDSLASPIYRTATHGFVVAADTPQFFPSSVSTIALLETLLSFVIAQAGSEIVQRVEAFHSRRHRLGLYAE